VSFVTDESGARAVVNRAVFAVPEGGSVFGDAVVATAGERASMRFLEFFAANIRHPRTRRAYARVAEKPGSRPERASLAHRASRLPPAHPSLPAIDVITRCGRRHVIS
jgi:hypothetical protein